MQWKSIMPYAMVAIVMVYGQITPSASDHDLCARAEHLIQQAIAIPHDPGDVQALMAKERLYLRAITHCPYQAQAHNDLGDIYEQLEQYAEAIAAYQTATRLRGDKAAPYFGLGDVYYKAGNYAQAIHWYDQGLALEPEDEVSQTFRRQASALLNKRLIPHHEIVKVLNPDITRGPGKPIITFGADAKQGLIPFDPGQSTLRADATRQLDELGKALASPELRDSIFEIGGHTDNQGHEEFNLKLSLDRAKAVTRYLVQHFPIAERRLQIKGYGEYRLIARGNTAAAHAMNRRVEVIKLGRPKEEGNDVPGKQQTKRLTHLAFTTGFLYKDKQLGQFQPIKTDGSTILYTNRNPYQIYFQPEQSSYVYILQRDAAERWYVLFPQQTTQQTDGWQQNPVQPGREYWLPGFGQGFPLDQTRGKEMIYFLAAARPIPELENATHRITSEVVTPIARGLRARGISHVGPLPSNAMPEREPNFTELIETIASEGGLARTITFLHQ